MTAFAWIIALIALGVALWAVIFARRAAVSAGDPASPEPVADDPHDEARLSAVFAALPVASVRVDSAGVITAVNPAALATFPFLDDGLGILEAFGDHQLAARVRDAALAQLKRELQDVVVDMMREAQGAATAGDGSCSTSESDDEAAEAWAEAEAALADLSMEHRPVTNAEIAALLQWLKFQIQVSL